MAAVLFEIEMVAITYKMFFFLALYRCLKMNAFCLYNRLSQNSFVVYLTGLFALKFLSISLSNRFENIVKLSKLYML